MMKNENGAKVFFFSFHYFIFFTTYEHHWKCLLDVQRGNTQHCGLDISRLPSFLINNKDYYVPNANLFYWFCKEIFARTRKGERWRFLMQRRHGLHIEANFFCGASNFRGLLSNYNLMNIRC